ncbi:MAG: hypothetical protein JSR46_04210 [Verrucomicrobia bacterium]|nr:hypothetical protein [Verrucomicrobiota bacterium]
MTVGEKGVQFIYQDVDAIMGFKGEGQYKGGVKSRELDKLKGLEYVCAKLFCAEKKVGETTFVVGKNSMAKFEGRVKEFALKHQLIDAKKGFNLDQAVLAIKAFGKEIDKIPGEVKQKEIQKLQGAISKETKEITVSKNNVDQFLNTIGLDPGLREKLMSNFKSKKEDEYTFSRDTFLKELTKIEHKLPPKPSDKIPQHLKQVSQEILTFLHEGMKDESKVDNAVNNLIGVQSTTTTTTTTTTTATSEMKQLKVKADSLYEAVDQDINRWNSGGVPHYDNLLKGLQERKTETNRHLTEIQHKGGAEVEEIRNTLNLCLTNITSLEDAVRDEMDRASKAIVTVTTTTVSSQSPVKPTVQHPVEGGLGTALPTGHILMSTTIFDELKSAFTFPGNTFEFIKQSIKEHCKGQEKPMNESKILKHFFDNNVASLTSLPKNLSATASYLAGEYSRYSHSEINLDERTVSMNKNAFDDFASKVKLGKREAADIWKNISNKQPSISDMPIKSLKQQCILKGVSKEEFQKALYGNVVVRPLKHAPTGTITVDQHKLISWSKEPEAVPEGTFVIAMHTLPPLLEAQPGFHQHDSGLQGISRDFKVLPDMTIMLTRENLQALLRDLKGGQATAPRAEAQLLAICDRAHEEEPVAQVQQAVVEEMEELSYTRPEWVTTDVLPPDADPTAPENQDAAMYGGTLKELNAGNLSSIKGDQKKLHALAYGLNLKYETKASQSDKVKSQELWNNIQQLSLFDKYLLWEIIKGKRIDIAKGKVGTLEKEIVNALKESFKSDNAECKAFRTYLTTLIENSVGTARTNLQVLSRALK